MRLYLTIILLFPLNLFAGGKISGDLIEYKDFKSSKFNVGDVQWSMLSEIQFIQSHGDCWTTFSGASVDSPELNDLGITTLPNAQGAFVRNSGGNAAPVLQVQADDVKSHSHAQSDIHCASGSCSYDSFQSPNGFISRGTRRTSNTSSDTYSRYSPYTENFGGIETRPVNVAMNLFVKIKENCE
jgi:hypothetical protein